MICYKDREWCTSKQCAEFSECNRALTGKVFAEAVEWWPLDGVPPIAQREFTECFVESQNERI